MAETGTSPRKLRLALVGCGVVSKCHLQAVAAQNPRRIRVVAVVEPHDERRAAAVAAVRALLGEEPVAFESLGQALSADPLCELFEACDIMVPNLGSLHEQVALEALRGGRHVQLEKPIAISVASAERILAGARALASDKVLMVAENSQYWREVVRTKRLLDAGAIGKVLMARAKYWESGHPALNEWAAAGSYDPGEYQCEGPEGFCFDGGLHWLRPLRMWLGQVSRVCATAGRTIQHMRGPGMLQALLEFSSGTTAIFEAVLAPGAISDQPFFVVQGTEGEIVLDGFRGGGKLHTVQDDVLRSADINEGHEGQIGWDTGYVGELDDFAAAVLDGRPPAATAQEAVEDLRVMLALMKSAKTQQWETVYDVDPELDMRTLGLELRQL